MAAGGEGVHGKNSELLDVLSEVKTRVQDKLGIVDFPMPQFILIGKQSVGKSRLIESLAGEQFNFISGTLGSRRPTILEFRNVQRHQTSQWFVLDSATKLWSQQSLSEVMKTIGNAHESLGATVSDVPVYVRVESPVCVDMSIVDLPGFRSFADDPAKAQLAEQIVALNGKFMNDNRNVMLCVEEAGDAANLSTLSQCKKIDPNFDRTILVRNKLDKYYRDLTQANIDQWMSGFGDLPDNLKVFSLTLPHKGPDWEDENLPPPGKSFAQLREEMDMGDQNEIKSKGANAKNLSSIGFSNFASYMEVRIEMEFVKAIEPVLTKLKALKTENSDRSKTLKEEIDMTDPSKILSTVRECGSSFSQCLLHIMEGQIGAASEVGRVQLDEELRAFHAHHSALGSDHFIMLPSDEFTSLDAYIDYLQNEFKVHLADADINGGAQWRRLLAEVEIFLRFSELGGDIKKRDVIQARGVSIMTLTWRDVVVKLLSNEAHFPMVKRVTYIAERLRYFFISHKDVILEFMVKSGQAGGGFSSLYSKHGTIMQSNPMIKDLIYTKYDEAVDRQVSHFKGLFENMLSSTFANPWLFLKQASMDADEGGVKDMGDRIPIEISSRASIETTLSNAINEIPSQADRINDASEKVQQLVLKVYSYIRSSVADQVEMFAESFYKTPMTRRLGEDMAEIELSEQDRASYEARRDFLDSQASECSEAVTEVEQCIQHLYNYKIKTQAKYR